MGNPYFTFLPWEDRIWENSSSYICKSSAFNNKTFALNSFVLADQLERCASILSFFHLCKNNFSKKQGLIPKGNSGLVLLLLYENENENENENNFSKRLPLDNCFAEAPLLVRYELNSIERDSGNRCYYYSTPTPDMDRTVSRRTQLTHRINDCFSIRSLYFEVFRWPKQR